MPPLYRYERDSLHGRFGEYGKYGKYGKSVKSIPGSKLATPPLLHLSVWGPGYHIGNGRFGKYGKSGKCGNSVKLIPGPKLAIPIFSSPPPRRPVLPHWQWPIW